MEHAQTGIQLAQSGRRAEALELLRRAAQHPTTAANPEVWLWLAHLTPDMQEYRHCVTQALLLSPTHPIAGQMQHALQPVPYQPYPPPMTDSAPIPILEPIPIAQAQPIPNRRRRRLRLMVLIILSMAGLAAALIIRQAADERQKASIPTIRTLSITTNDHTFRVDVPQSWLVADRDDPVWQNTRQAINARWPELTVWDTIAVDVTAITVEVTGAVQPPLTVIETDLTAIARDQNNPLRLQWIRVASVSDTACAGMRVYAEEQESQLQRTLQNNIVGTEVRETNPDYCIFVVHYRGQSPLSQETEDIFVLHIPIDATTLAEWHLTVRDKAYPSYRVTIERVLSSIQVVE